MKKFIKNWKHLPGIHCGSVAIRDVSYFYGLDFTEEFCFGLGGGLGFYYSKSDSMSPTRTIHVRGPGMENNFFNYFGLETEDWKKENDATIAFEELKRFINMDVPVLIQTDIYYLDYYNSSTHFPGHIVVVYGYDDEEGIFYLSDTGFEDSQKVKYENMVKARSSKAEPYPLQNNWFEVVLNEKNVNMKETVQKSLLKNSKSMIDGIETPRGVSSVEKLREWSEDLLVWQELEDWKWSSRFAYQVINRRGTEGAAFRHMYRDYLMEVENLTPIIEDLEMIKKMDKIGYYWLELSLLLKEISELEEVQDNKFKIASEKVMRIYELEKEFYESIISSLN